MWTCSFKEKGWKNVMQHERKDTWLKILGTIATPRAVGAEA
jgi:hypothetical protein